MLPLPIRQAVPAHNGNLFSELLSLMPLLNLFDY